MHPRVGAPACTWAAGTSVSLAMGTFGHCGMVTPRDGLDAWCARGWAGWEEEEEGNVLAPPRTKRYLLGCFFPASCCS